MPYFDDLQFVDASVVPGCRAVLDRRFPGTYSIEFLLAGRMTFGVDHGESILLTEPAAFWHHPQHTYQYGAVDARGWDHHWVLMKGARARRLVEEGLMPLAPAGYLPVRQAQAVADLFRGLVNLVKEGAARRQGDRVVLVGRILCALLEDARVAGSTSAHKAAMEVLMRRLSADPCAPVDFHAVARTFHLSYSQFRRLFRAVIGHAPHAFLLLARMRHAAQLLQDPARQVKEVAVQCGYEDPAQFCKLFKKKIGLAPQTYRRALVRGE